MKYFVCQHLHYHSGHHINLQENYVELHCSSFYIVASNCLAIVSLTFLGYFVNSMSRTLQACIFVDLTPSEQRFHADYKLMAWNFRHALKNKIEVQGFAKVSQIPTSEKDQLQLDFANWFEPLEGSRISALVFTWGRVAITRVHCSNNAISQPI